jgi:hypothetical protein
MAAWWIPALKAVLPHVSTVISAASPVFTRRKAAAVANHTALLQEQVNELQTAALSNAAHIKELAAQLQTTVNALESAASSGEAKLSRALLFCGISVVFSALALAASAFLFFSR